MTKSEAMKLALKIGISLIIMVALITQIRPDRLSATLKAMGFLPLAMAVVFYLFAQLISAYRWRGLANAMAIGGGLGEYYRYYLKGMFLNLFLPTAIGGDVGRVVMLSRSQGCTWLQAFLSILCERTCGLVGLMLYAVVGIFIMVPSQWPLYGSIALGMLLLASGFTMGFRRLDHTLWGQTLINRFVLKQQNLHDEPAEIWPKTRPVLTGFAISLVFHLMVITVQMYLLHRLGGSTPFLILASIYGLAGVASMIPLSFNGIGLREGAMTLLLILWSHVTREVATAYSLVWLSVLVLAAIPGGILFLVDQFRPVRQET